MGAGGAIQPTERSIQRAILAMRRICFPRVFMFHVPNGAHLAGNQVARFKQMGALKGDGLVNGVPDLFAVWAVSKVCALEVKRTSKSPVSDEQKAIHELLRSLGIPVEIVTSTQEAFDLLKGLGAPWSGVPCP
jgi:hypothetical protein